MKTKKFYLQSGVSLIELMMALTLIMILTTISILYFGNSKTDLQRQRIAREFKVYLERARFDSVKRRATDINDMSRIILKSPSAFTAAIDLNEDGKLDPTDVRQVDFTQRSDAQITVSNTLSYPVTILFNQRGQIIAQDSTGSSISPVFTICSKNCSGTAGQDKTVISVSTTGTVAVLKNGQNPSALPTPAISNASTEFNCYVLLGNSNSSSCTTY